MPPALLLALAVLAQASATPPAVPAPSEKDLADIERALGADSKAPDAAAGAVPVAPVTPATSGFTANPDMALILDGAIAAYSADEPRQGGGHDPAHNGFNLQQLELALGKAVDPFFRLDAFIVFSQSEVEVEEAYATTLALPGNLQARAGQFLTRFGRHNPTHPHAWDFIDQPFVMTRMFGGEGNRGLGVELSWLTPLPWYAELIGSATDAAGEGTARSFYGSKDLGVHSLRDPQYTTALRQFFPLSDDLSLLWGLSAALGPNPNGYRTRSEIAGTDLYLKYRPLASTEHRVISLQAEALARRRQIPGDALRDWGAYAQLLLQWTRRWAAGLRYEYGSPIWNRAGDVAGADPLDPLWQGHRHRVSAALTFWPTEFSRLRLQGSRDTTSSGPTPHVYALMLALEVLAGAHGAHAF
jgi:hypothetical protein